MRSYSGTQTFKKKSYHRQFAHVVVRADIAVPRSGGLIHCRSRCCQCLWHTKPPQEGTSQNKTLLYSFHAPDTSFSVGTSPSFSLAFNRTAGSRN